MRYGTVPAGVGGLTSFLVAHRGNRIRILATSGSRRVPVAPDLPTAAEAGYHDQSHLSREFRKMTGLSPRRFTACAGMSENGGEYGFIAYRPDPAAALR